MKRRPSARIIERNEPVLERIRALKADHPFWGYRRVWAYLRFADGLEVNKKRVLRLMREHDLTVGPNTRIRAKRLASRPKPRPTRPNQWWGIDMTKVLTRDAGWVYVTIVLDWFTKKFVGVHAGRRSTSRDWLAAVEAACHRQFPIGGVRGQGLSLMSDNGCQPTSIAFMKACRTLGIDQAFTSYNNPKGNADTERAIRTMKEELLWLHEWNDAHHLEAELLRWIDTFNGSYLHSALGYKTPSAFEQQHRDSSDSHLTAA